MMPLHFLCNKCLNECCSDKTDCNISNCNQLVLKYFCCDDITGQKGYQRQSFIDAIKISKKNNVCVLVEIKNRPISNIDKDEVKKQLNSTIDYLEINSSEILKNGIKFFVSISPSPKKNSKNIEELQEAIASCKLGIFYNTFYKYKSKNKPITYNIKSNIIFCDETDFQCK